MSDINSPSPLSKNFDPPKQSDPIASAQASTADDFRNYLESNPQGRFSEITSEAEMFRLSRYVLDNWDLNSYDELKARHSREESGTPKHKLKYLDLFSWLGGRMNPAILMGLQKSAPLSILDIGTGPGHFAVIAKYFGHQVLTSDIPDGEVEGSVRDRQIPPANKSDNFYEELISFFGLDRKELRIKPLQSVGSQENKFDLITLLMPSFEKYPYEKKLWSFEEWGFLIDDLRQNLLNEGGRMYFWLSRTPQFEGPQPNDPEFVSFMESKGATADIGRSAFMFGSF